jgi:cell division protein FtsL
MTSRTAVYNLTELQQEATRLNNDLYELEIKEQAYSARGRISNKND